MLSRASSTPPRPLSARKGLRNDLGANNCFLNVIIQSLWHVRSCRVLLSMGDHAVHHRGQPSGAQKTITPCLLCELEQIFVLYQFAEQPVLDVDRVRLALGATFALGAMNDATETLEAILDALHYDTFNRMLQLRRGGATGIGGLNKVEDMSESLRQDASAIICEPQCVAHRLFQMNLMELKVCASCGHTAEPVMNTDFLYRVYAQELLNNARAGAQEGVKKNVTLEDVLRLEAQSQDVAGTCDACEKGGQRALCRWILTLPMVFSISIIWSSSHVNKTDIKDWMELLSSQCKVEKESQQALDLGRIFRLDNSADVSSLYSFRGLVCYYGRHYVGFFASRSLEDGVERERWFLFDDTRVKLVGTWADVRLRIERGGYQPTLLFYERNGIEHENLENIATEIHKWWEETADSDKKDEAVEKKPVEIMGTNGKGAPHEVDLGGGVEDELLAKMERSVRITQENPLPPLVPTGPKMLPTSPISLPPRAPKSMPAKNGSQAREGWRDEDIHLHMAHQNAQDTLSRLNGILSKDKPPASAPVDGRTVLRMAMSQSMRRSVRLRDYSVHRPAEKQMDVNPDKIFEDETVSESTAEEGKSIEINTMPNGSVVAKPNEGEAATPQAPLKVFDVRLNASDGGIGLLLEEAASNDSLETDAKKAFSVSGFDMNGAGAKLPAEASGAICKGDILVGINGHVLEREELVHVLEMLLMSPNPVQLKFHRYQSWGCPRCTLLNKPTDSLCAACGHAPVLQT
ncbi:Inactive ubiquitin carboxyl-terminal hydrolase 54 [Phytophthora ramorum]|uniref:Inactive ubiquitin carboxyl-terminal hydrolase 54 n=1 Tax=Phytophthora ramorum TaxID=164328 RepID=UPI0030B41376|nr:Inactive ubiquitin carboxyl-terminal hydrolase 54 [Phytophthora ramorum]